MTIRHVLGDWGTSRLRLFLFADGRLVDRRDGPGIGALDRPADTVLAEHLAPWQQDGPIDTVTLCGMAGARGGLVEAGYVACPAGVEVWRGQATWLEVDGSRIAVLPGLRSPASAPVPDVMRGEETQIFGAFALDPALARGVHRLVLPGTHSKWVRVEDGTVWDFRTFPTGEVYALLSRRSTLAGPQTAVTGTEDDPDGFAHGLARSDEPVLGALFEARAGQLLDGRSPDWARAYLSGLLIGAEVTAQALVDDGSEIVLIGDPMLCDRYARALAARGRRSRTLDGEATVLAGLALGRNMP